jgi:hypothetical protein
MLRGRVSLPVRLATTINAVRFRPPRRLFASPPPPCRPQYCPRLVTNAPLRPRAEAQLFSKLPARHSQSPRNAEKQETKAGTAKPLGLEARAMRKTSWKNLGREPTRPQEVCMAKRVRIINSDLPHFRGTRRRNPSFRWGGDTVSRSIDRILISKLDKITIGRYDCNCGLLWPRASLSKQVRPTVPDAP